MGFGGVDSVNLAFVIDSVRALLDSVVDYAGLFPPAALAMVPAVANYARYRHRGHAWMLGRFVLPVARLDEFEKAALEHIDKGDGEPWHLSALGGSDVAAAVAAIKSFNARHQRAVIDTLELKADSPQQIETARQHLPDDLTTYFEIPSNHDPVTLVETIARFGVRAKIRTGGVTGNMIPAAADVARFLRRCDEAKIAFKATAGLHHAFRADYRLTYEADSACATMYGFMNVYLAAAFLWAGISDAQMTAILQEPSARAFRFDRKGIGWRDRWISTQQIEAARRRFIIAFGSCSFEEPVAELEAAGLR